MNNHIFSHLVHTPVKPFSVAKPMQSMFVPSIKTLEVQAAANDEVMEVNFRELEQVVEKMKWQQLFSKAYSGGARSITASLFNAQNTIYVVAYADGKDMGYLRLVKKRMSLTSGAVTVWSLDTAFVKEPYRSKAVFKKLIAHAVDVYAMKLIHLEAYRFYGRQYYYECLGFSQFAFVDDTDLGYAVHDSFHQMIACMKPLAA